jgi:hypothetical protein
MEERRPSRQGLALSGIAADNLESGVARQIRIVCLDPIK